MPSNWFREGDVRLSLGEAHAYMDRYPARPPVVIGPTLDEFWGDLRAHTNPADREFIDLPFSMTPSIWLAGQYALYGDPED